MLQLPLRRLWRSFDLLLMRCCDLLRPRPPKHEKVKHGFELQK